MTRANGPDDLAALDALAKLARDTVQRASAGELDRGLKRILARVTKPTGRRTTITRWSLVALIAALCTALGFHVTSVLRGRAVGPALLAYRVEGGSVLAGGYLRDEGDDGVRLIFDEGTRVELQSGARGRLRTANNQETRVVLDQGSASFDVARSHERRWLVDAGPFSVAVKGTFFTVSWDAAAERFELRLQHGSVVVSGPIASGDIELRAGQRLVVSVPRAETVITEDQPTESASKSSPTPSSVAANRDPVAREVTAEPPAPRTATPAEPFAAGKVQSESHSGERKPSWAKYVALGHWDRILEEAALKGVDKTLETASSEDLFALADAARYRHRADLARSALLTQRRRFAGTARSLDATFLLGRLEETTNRAQALGWYDQYLSRSASGTYAAEAWGRKMVLTSELEGRASARPIAEEYLRRFPKGSYARAARALCEP